MAYFTKYLRYLPIDYNITNTSGDIAGIAFPYKYAGKDYDINNYTSDGNKVEYGSANTSIVSYKGKVGRIVQKNDSIANGFVILPVRSTSISGYPMMSITDSRVSDSTLSINVPSTTISGKYRFKSALYWSGFWEQLYDATISVRVAINGELKRAVIFCTNTNWSRERNDVSSPPSSIYIQTYNEYGDGKSQPPDLYGGYTNNGVDLTSNYINMIWDFGSIPQEVPDAFKNWVEFNADVMYTYTYTVKSSNGMETLSTRGGSPAIKAVTVSEIGNIKTCTLTGTNDIDYTLTWESVTPKGKRFLGLAYDTNETRASIPNGQTTPVTWDGSQTVYEVYATYHPPVTTFDINLYQNSAEVNRVDKSSYLTSVGVLSGVLREECSIVAPTITFRQDSVPTFNYVYIAAFDRYYFVTGITSVSKNIWRMSLSCDVLMTWKDNIGSLTAIIARQQLYYNTYLIDAELPAQANQQIEVHQFPSLAGDGFDTSVDWDYSFVLTVVGG